MRQWMILIVLFAAMLIFTGCGVNIPPKLEVRDVSSGRTYQTYQDWGQVEKGIGYGFTDLETGKKITLTNYEIRTLESGKSVPDNSPEAKSYEAAKDRGGVK